MKRTLAVMLFTAACGALAAGASPAEAKGCIKGAVVGAVAGHVAGHGVLGAAGGCAVGHHMANKVDRNNVQQQQQQQPQTSANGVQSRP